jgi:DNA-binding transcriptional LysR family regulator
LILRRLRYFAAVADEGGISRAAVRLHVAQPALSRQIKSLERTLGTALFERDNRGVQLTPVGQRLREDVERVFARLDELVRGVLLAHEGRRGTLRLGLSRGALISHRIGKLFMAFRARYPDVELLVREIEVWAQAQALKANDVDAVIGLGEERDPAFRSSTLFEARIDSALFARSHRLAHPGAIDPAELMSEPLRVDGNSLPRFPGLREALRRLGFAWDEVEGIDTVYGYVASGNGWTVTLSSTHAEPPAGLVARPIRGLDVPVPMLLRWRRNDDLPVLRHLARVAAQARDVEMEEYGPVDHDGPSLETVEAIDATARTRGIEVAQLVALLTSLHEGSLSAAAERLGLTQSAVSRQIRSLERAVGVPLTVRAGGRLGATSAGALLRDDAPVVLELIDNALARARRTVRGTKGRCAIGTISRELTNGLLIEALRQLTTRHPDVAITVVEGRSQDALLVGEIDLAVVACYPGAEEHSSISSIFLRDDPLTCALLAASHPLAMRDTLSPTDLMHEPLLFVSRAFAPQAHDLIVHELRQLGLGARFGAEYNGARAIWRAVASGGGWAVGPRSFAAEAPPTGIVARPIEGLNIPWGIGLQWRRGESDPCVTCVMDVFREQGERLRHATGHGRVLARDGA